MSGVGAIILAAGGSTRFGRPKQLIAFRGEPLVRLAARVAAEAGCSPIVVVAGEIVSAIRSELETTTALVVENGEWQRGLGTSIRAGVGQLGDTVAAALLMTCDQPLVTSSVLTELIAARQKTGKPIIASSYANTLGIPALFDRSFFDALLTLPDNSGAKSLIEARREETASVSFEDGAIDIDTAEDFERLKADRG
jgi:molybdenum cofactor cytidylyltransferase